jgi:hypothetical protein
MHDTPLWIISINAFAALVNFIVYSLNGNKGNLAAGWFSLGVFLALLLAS